MDAYRADFDRLIASDFASDPEWLKRFRTQAMDSFETLGFPTMKDEDWHFTSVSPIADRVFHPAPQSKILRDTVEKLAITKSGGLKLVFVNGLFMPEPSFSENAIPGLTVQSLAAAIREDASLETLLGSAAGITSSAFTALNSAFFRDGTLIRIAKGANIDRTIDLLFVSTGSADSVVHPRNLIVAERESQATITETYIGIGESTHFTNTVTEVLVAENARVSHYKLQRESANAFHVGTAQAKQSRNSYYESFCFSTGADLSRTNVYTVLEGDAAECVLNGLYLADGTQHMDHQTYVEHVAPNCPSHELYKGILDGRSHGVFNGKVYVHPEAQKTDGKQSNNNLLLSDHARVDTKPQLEIFADDVKCTHGATVGRLDETALFYLRSRGINKSVARKLLTYAFAADVLERLPHAELKEALEARVLERFTG
jgi:Fe-S cluster assembly protein SufD